MAVDCGKLCVRNIIPRETTKKKNYIKDIIKNSKANQRGNAKTSQASQRKTRKRKERNNRNAKQKTKIKW